VEIDMYNLLIVDDESLVRRGIKAFVDFEQLQIDQVYEAENGEQALSILQVMIILTMRLLHLKQVLLIMS
jgi:YesN/AraC family two-component response regulator